MSFYFLKNLNSAINHGIQFTITVYKVNMNVIVDLSTDTIFQC